MKDTPPKKHNLLQGNKKIHKTKHKKKKPKKKLFFFFFPYFFLVVLIFFFLVLFLFLILLFFFFMLFSRFVLLSFPHLLSSSSSLKKKTKKLTMRQFVNLSSSFAKTRLHNFFHKNPQEWDLPQKLLKRERTGDDGRQGVAMVP